MTSALGSETRSCRICGRPGRLQPTGRVIRSYPLASCSYCGTVLVEKRPDPLELKAMYDRLFDTGEYEQHRAEFELLKSGRRPPNFERRRLLRRLEKSRVGRTLVEIGGGTGKFGLDARDRGWRYTNYDISEIAIRFCRELGLEAHCFQPDHLPPLGSATADVVVMWEVIEHVWDARGCLEAVRTALRRGGIFVLSTPNYLTPVLHDTDDWGLLSSPPIHLNFFTRLSLERTLREVRFDTVTVSPRRLYRPSGSFASWVRSLRFALLLDEPETLYAMAGKV